jgi:hypothetical protein
MASVVVPLSGIELGLKDLVRLGGSACANAGPVHPAMISTDMFSTDMIATYTQTMHRESERQTLNMARAPA